MPSHYLNQRWLIISPVHGRWNKGTGFPLVFVRPSIWPSVDKVSGTFRKTIGIIFFHYWHLPLCPSMNFGPLVPKYFKVKNGVSRTFWKKLLAHFISYLAVTLIELVSWLIFLASISALWWPNIWPKMGFLEFTFKKKLNSFHTWHSTLCSMYLDYYSFSCSINCSSVVPNICPKRWFMRFFYPMTLHAVGKTMPEFFWKQSFLESFPPVQYSQWLQNKNFCWIFLDKLSSDQSGGIVAIYGCSLLLIGPFVTIWSGI